ncbi:MAG: hypothetical protein QXW79_00305 [Thermoplasmata archaeon]
MMFPTKVVVIVTIKNTNTIHIFSKITNFMMTKIQTDMNKKVTMKPNAHVVLKNMIIVVVNHIVNRKNIAVKSGKKVTRIRSVVAEKNMNPYIEKNVIVLELPATSFTEILDTT